MTSLNIAQIAGVALNANKDLAKSAAFLEAGRIANNKLVAVASSQLPLMARGYANTPVGKLVLANLLLISVQKFKPDNATLAKLGYAAVTQAYAELIQSFDIEGVIDGFLKDTRIAQVLGSLDTIELPTAQ